MSTNLQTYVAPCWMLLPATLLAALLSNNPVAGGVQDVMLQTMDGKVVTGVVDDVTGVGTLGHRVFGGQFQLVSGNLRASNPGFFGLRTGDPNMPPGGSGFPSQHDVNFDLLPMSIGPVASNLFYWDGADANGGGINLTDVNFAVPTGVFWDVFDANFAPTTVSGTNEFVSGGLIQQTSSDIWPDEIDSGTIHKHLALQVRDNDGNSGTTAPAGIYLISWQARSAGFETSAPFFFVFRTPLPTMTDAIRDVAVSWVEQNIDALTSIPGDYNGDGTVDAADYVMWRKTDGTQIGYDTWRANFDRTMGGGAMSDATVPEPAAGLLLTLGTVAGCWRKALTRVPRSKTR